jgi:hypothetical protein
MHDVAGIAAGVCCSHPDGERPRSGAVADVASDEGEAEREGGGAKRSAGIGGGGRVFEEVLHRSQVAGDSELGNVVELLECRDELILGALR